MDEASSKFVDQLALEKLIAEKLAAAHHRPAARNARLFEPAFEAFAAPITAPCLAPIAESEGGLTLRSPARSGYPENDIIPVSVHRAHKERGAVLLLHGLYEDNRAMYKFLVRELSRLGMTVYLTTLPFHHERVPREAGFSGDLFLCANLERTKQAFIQAVVETRFTYDWIRRHTEVPVFVTGFSMGGTVAFGAAAVDEQINGTVIVNPAAVLGEVIWTSPLCGSIKTDLLDGGWSRDDIERVLGAFDPYAMPVSEEARRRTMLIFAAYDQITRQAQYAALNEKWRFNTVLRYNAGHLNTLRVPRLAGDIVRFFDNLSTGDPSGENGGGE